MTDGQEIEAAGPLEPDGGGVVDPGEQITRLDIQDEMRDSYLTYAMSVIISRALPDARDGLKPSQGRILVAMNDLRLGPNSSRVKCAKISGDTSGNYHPHGDGSIYPTLVRMGHDWIMRDVLIDKQGNCGSVAGLPPGATKYEATSNRLWRSAAWRALKPSTSVSGVAFRLPRSTSLPEAEAA